MHSFDIRVFEDQDLTVRQGRRRPAGRLRAMAAVMLTLAGGVPSGLAQQVRSSRRRQLRSRLKTRPHRAFPRRPHR